MSALCPLLKLQKKIKPVDWTPKHNKAFKNNKKLVSEITKNKHFDQHLDTRVVSDACSSGSGAALEQHTLEGWVVIAYASRLLNSLEEKSSVIELELLGVV